MNPKLAGVHPLLVAAVERILAAMTALGYPMMVTDGVRTEAQQAKLYAQGRTAPGRIVTNAKGTEGSRSNHQAKADGLGYAVDCCFVIAGKPSWDERLPWTLYGHMARTLGMQWGGDWTKPDKPHIEMPEIR